MQCAVFPVLKCSQQFLLITVWEFRAPLKYVTAVHVYLLLQVNEAGTTAGASFSQTQTKSAPRYVNVNHPFYIILKEKHTKMPLFMGRITRPTPI